MSKIINAEGIVWGELPAPVQQEIRDKRGKDGWRIEMRYNENWKDTVCPEWFGGRAYRAVQVEPPASDDLSDDELHVLACSKWWKTNDNRWVDHAYRYDSLCNMYLMADVGMVYLDWFRGREYRDYPPRSEG